MKKRKNAPGFIAVKVYLIISLGLIAFLLAGHTVLAKVIMINVILVSLLILCTKYLNVQDRFFIAIIILTWSVYSSYLTISVGIGLQDIDMLVQKGGRVQLSFQNPNFLAVFLLNSFLTSFLLLQNYKRYKLILFLLMVVTGVAIVFTGSRTTLLAWLILLTIIYGHSILVKRWSEVVTLSILMGISGALIVIVTFMNSKTQDMVSSKNLLKESERLATTWIIYGDAEIDITLIGKEEGYNVHHLEGTTPKDTRLFFLTGVKRSVIGEDYIASVYLRSEKPQQIILNTQLSQATCDVDKKWSRCVTPSGKGDDYAWLQFRLEGLSSEQRIDLYMTQPQLEVGSAVTAYQPKNLPSRMLYLSQRLRSGLFVNEDSVWATSGRPEAWMKGWRLFLKHPWVGVGGDRFAEYGRTEITHSHNIFIQILATQGLVGVMTWSIVGHVMLSSMTKRQRYDFSSMLLVTFILNTTDYTFVHGSSLYTFFFIWSCIYFDGSYYS